MDNSRSRVKSSFRLYNFGSSLVESGFMSMLRIIFIFQVIQVRVRLGFESSWQIIFEILSCSCLYLVKLSVIQLVINTCLGFRLRFGWVRDYIRICL